MARLRTALFWIGMISLGVGDLVFRAHFAKAPARALLNLFGIEVLFFPYWNRGVALSFLSDLPEALRVLGLALVGLYLFFAYVALYSRVPYQARWFRLGLTFALVGWLTNLVDRIIHGAVFDYFGIAMASAQWGSPIYNFADGVQMLGYLLMGFALPAEAEWIFRKLERRGKLWIYPKTQGWWIARQLALTSLVFGCCLALSWSWMVWSGNALSDSGTAFLKLLLLCFPGLLGVTAYFGLHWSHSAVGPILRFKSWIASNRERPLTLRNGDLMKDELESLAATYTKDVS